MNIYKKGNTLTLLVFPYKGFSRYITLDNKYKMNEKARYNHMKMLIYL